MKNLNDKVVVITGAGSGMGREMALIAARQGALVAVSDWNEPALDETVDLLKQPVSARCAVTSSTSPTVPPWPLSPWRSSSSSGA